MLLLGATFEPKRPADYNKRAPRAWATDGFQDCTCQGVRCANRRASAPTARKAKHCKLTLRPAMASSDNEISRSSPNPVCVLGVVGPRSGR
eukprot:7462842-Alexandrium_andersonii.AAC.1